MQDFQAILIPVISLIIIGGAIALLLTIRLSKRALLVTQFIIPQAMPAEGVEIPLIRAFTGIKGWGALYVAQNSIKPLLRLYETHMEYRVFIPKTATYREVERVAGYCRRFFNYMRFEFGDRTQTFTAYLVNEEEYQVVERFLRAKGVPVDTRH